MATAAEKPTLHEIAAMPYPASEQAMREFYDKNWGKYSKGEEPKTFAVTVEYEIAVEDEDEFEVEASCEEEAKELAREMFYAEHSRDHEIVSVSAEEKAA